MVSFNTARYVQNIVQVILWFLDGEDNLLFQMDNIHAIQQVLQDFQQFPRTAKFNRYNITILSELETLPGYINNIRHVDDAVLM